MLRFALLVLLLANAGYLAWTQGWMATLGWTPAVTPEEGFRRTVAWHLEHRDLVHGIKV